jgi:hypothetical protein
VRPSSRIEVAIRTWGSAGFFSQFPIDRRHVSIELAENSLDAVTPCGSRLQPTTRMQSSTSPAIARM